MFGLGEFRYKPYHLFIFMAVESLCTGEEVFFYVHWRGSASGNLPQGFLVGCWPQFPPGSYT